MNDKSQRVAGIFIAPLLMLAGLWLCLDGLEHGKLTGIFSIGPFVAVAAHCGLSRIGLSNCASAVPRTRALLDPTAKPSIKWWGRERKIGLGLRTFFDLRNALSLDQLPPQSSFFKYSGKSALS